MSADRLDDLKRKLDELTLLWEPFDDDLSDHERALFEETLAAFRSTGADVLDKAAQHIRAYYRHEWSAYTPDERAEYAILEIGDHENIWDHVQITEPPTVQGGGHPLQPADSYLAFEGEVPWEPEHGLDLVFENGRRIVKVGPCDGHSTNAHAYGDEALIDVIFVE